MAEVYKKTLIHEWDFLGEERTEDERLTDTVGGVKAKLGYNASLQPEGIYLSYGDANYMKAYALMECLQHRSKTRRRMHDRVYSDDQTDRRCGFS